MNMVQGYMTTNTPVDEGGNYYYPIFVPENVAVTMPITKIVPDAKLGDKGLKFNWERNEWVTSEQDPTVRMLKQLQASVTGNNMAMLSMMKDQLSDGGDK